MYKLTYAKFLDWLKGQGICDENGQCQYIRFEQFTIAHHDGYYSICGDSGSVDFFPGESFMFNEEGRFAVMREPGGIVEFNKALQDRAEREAKEKRKIARQLYVSNRR